MREIIENQQLDEERALYGRRNISVRNCRFDGPADGESAFKECADLEVERCFFNLRYPFWHDHYLTISDSEMTELCRAALWYTDHARIQGTKLHGIKALRECSDIALENCQIVSPEFGWSVNGCSMKQVEAAGEYFMLRSENLKLEQVKLSGKYSFQYIRQAEISQCDFDTKDAFWHSSHVTVRDSVLKGEYLAWYSDHLTLINCKIIGTQPFCYCTDLKLVDCEMVGTDLSFEKSSVEAVLTAPIDSIKNPIRGFIQAPAAGQVILDDPQAMEGGCRLLLGEQK